MERKQNGHIQYTDTNSHLQYLQGEGGGGGGGSRGGVDILTHLVYSWVISTGKQKPIKDDNNNNKTN